MELEEGFFFKTRTTDKPPYKQPVVCFLVESITDIFRCCSSYFRSFAAVRLCIVFHVTQ